MTSLTTLQFRSGGNCGYLCNPPISWDSVAARGASTTGLKSTMLTLVTVSQSAFAPHYLLTPRRRANPFKLIDKATSSTSLPSRTSPPFIASCVWEVSDRTCTNSCRWRRSRRTGRTDDVVRLELRESWGCRRDRRWEMEEVLAGEVREARVSSIPALQWIRDSCYRKNYDSDSPQLA